MHHALEIQEILLNIFGHCHPGDLPSPARTCRTFKEPALDVLWEELDDLSPLVRCLPDASYQLSPDKYSFSRPLTQNEGDILQRYTRRIRSMRDVTRKLGESSFKILSNAPTTEALFPNVRSLDCGYTRGRLLSHFPFPSLICLNVHYQHLQGHRLQNAFQLFTDSSPNIRRISLRHRSFDLAFSKVVSNRLCRWQDLQTVVFPEIFLEVDALVHLSRMPALTRLDFVLSATFPASDSHLFFPNLHHITLRSKSLEAVTRLLSRTWLPAITDFTAIIDDCPSRKELSLFFIGVQSSITGNTIKVLELHQKSWPTTVRSEGLLLYWEDLQPCMAFRNLLCISLDIEWKVGLMDNELLALALAWPHLEDLLINPFWGWNSPGGITPNGLLQLLEKCRSIHCITLAIDTRGYTELPPSGLLASLGLTSPRTIYLDVLYSVIQAESVPAVAAFLGCTPCSTFSFTAWASYPI